MPVEEPPYRLQLRDGPFEVRDYPALVTAEVTVSGAQTHAVGQGFRILAAYIFGANARREKIAMTAPVTLQPASPISGLPAPSVTSREAGEWVVTFTMPKALSIDRLPPPQDGRIRLRRVAPMRVAVARFSGVAQPKDFEAQTRALSVWMQRRALRGSGPAALAQYDPPWTLWFLRRNEVLIPVGG